MARTKSDLVADFRRSQIHVARATFARHGLAGATVDQVARTAGLAKGTISTWGLPVEGRNPLAGAGRGFDATAGRDFAGDRGGRHARRPSAAIPDPVGRLLRSPSRLLRVLPLRDDAGHAAARQAADVGDLCRPEQSLAGGAEGDRARGNIGGAKRTPPRSPSCVWPREWRCNACADGRTRRSKSSISRPGGCRRDWPSNEADHCVPRMP